METITNTNRPASEKQQAFVARLLAEKDTTGTAYEGWTPDWSVATTRSASHVIDYLMSLPRKAEGSAPAATEVPEGMHRLNGKVFKVQRAVHGSGNLYAKQLVRQDEERWTFDYAPGVIRNLSEDTAMTLEEAKEFGALYGTCCVCARTLTNEESIEAGIGPVCASKF